MAEYVEEMNIKDFVEEANRRGGGVYRLGYSEDGALVVSSLRATICFDKATLYYHDGFGKSLLLDSKTPGVENGRVGISDPVSVEHIKSGLHSAAFAIITKRGDRHIVFLNTVESDKPSKKRGRPKKE